MKAPNWVLPLVAGMTIGAGALYVYLFFNHTTAGVVIPAGALYDVGVQCQYNPQVGGYWNVQ